MPAVFIYNQRKLEYVVLPNRRIFSNNDRDLIEPITNAERHPLWKTAVGRNQIQEEGERFFKSNGITQKDDL